MKPADIASPLAPFLGGDALSPEQLRQVSTYLDLLLKWNARINLTSVRHPEEILTRHFGESFFTARQLLGAAADVVIPSEARARAAGSAQSRDLGSRDLIDLGSGAGFPGLPIKIYAPALTVTLIESNQKKATFLHEVIRALTLTNVNVFAGRAESFPGPAAIVTLRAVEKHQRALAAAARLVSPGGRLALLLGTSQLPCLLPGFSWDSPIALPGSTGRLLCVGSPDQPEPSV